jgi:hypothetical protein
MKYTGTYTALQALWNARHGGASIRLKKTSCPGEALARLHSAALPSDDTVRDACSRHPQLSVPGFMRSCDYFGTWVFAISGTLTAATSGLDLLGCVVVGSITALGGGTARDMIMGQVSSGYRVRAIGVDCTRCRADARSGSTSPSTCGSLY